MEQVRYESNSRNKTRVKTTESDSKCLASNSLLGWKTGCLSIPKKVQMQVTGATVSLSQRDWTTWMCLGISHIYWCNCQNSEKIRKMNRLTAWCHGLSHCLSIAGKTKTVRIRVIWRIINSRIRQYSSAFSLEIPSTWTKIWALLHFQIHPNLKNS